MVVSGAVDADADLRAEALHGASGGPDALGLQQVIGQLFMGPVGAVQPLLGRPFDDPALDLLGQFGRDVAGLARGLARADAVEATVEIGVEPALHGACGDGQVGSDVLVGSVATGKADDLDAVFVLRVGLLAVGLLEALRLPFGQSDADHFLFPLSFLPYYTHQTTSQGTCMRNGS